jgi:tetratricopeptide (TPR) repeat protein
MIEWYLAAAGVADLMLTPHRRRLPYTFVTAPPDSPPFADRSEALSWLERERVNLIAAGRAALENRWAELAWQLSDVMWPLLLYSKVPNDRRTIDVQGLAAARLWGNPWAEGRMLKRLGRTCTTLGEYVLAEQHLQAAVARCDEAADIEGGIEAHEMLASLYRDSGRESAALELFLDVLTARRRSADNRSTSLTLINIGTLLSRLRRPGEATTFLQEAVALLSPLVGVDPYNSARARLGLADALLRLRELDRAERLAAEAVDGMRTAGSAFGEAEALEVLGRLAERRSDFARSHRFLSQALEIFDALGSHRSAAVHQILSTLPAPPEVEKDGDGLD